MSPICLQFWKILKFEGFSLRIFEFWHIIGRSLKFISSQTMHRTLLLFGSIHQKHVSHITVEHFSYWNYSTDCVNILYKASLQTCWQFWSNLKFERFMIKKKSHTSLNVSLFWKLKNKVYCYKPWEHIYIQEQN